MHIIEYTTLDNIDPAYFLRLLNKPKLRIHLVDHSLFGMETAKDWIRKKIEMNSLPGCKVRAILIDKQFAGWCGIQRNSGKYELALMLDNCYWGLGIKIFRDLITWAKDIGHNTVVIHLLYTRREYRHLRQIANKVYESRSLGTQFTTYELTVEQIQLST